VDIRIAENAEAEHAKVEAERRRVADLEKRVADAERASAEAATRVDQAERRRVEAYLRAADLESEINEIRARTSQSSAAPTSSRRFVAPAMTPIGKRDDSTRSAPGTSAPPIDADAVEAAIRRAVAEQNGATMTRVNAVLSEMLAEQDRLATQLHASQSAPPSQSDIRLPHPPAYTGLPGATELSVRDFISVAGDLLRCERLVGRTSFSSTHRICSDSTDT